MQVEFRNVRNKTLEECVRALKDLIGIEEVGVEQARNAADQARQSGNSRNEIACGVLTSSWENLGQPHTQPRCTKKPHDALQLMLSSIRHHQKFEI